MAGGAEDVLFFLDEYATRVGRSFSEVEIVLILLSFQVQKNILQLNNLLWEMN